MAQEHVVYTQSWFSDRVRLWVREMARSVAFGGILFLSFVFLLGPAAIFATLQASVDPSLGTSYESTAPLILALLLVGAPLCILCWWAALEVADDRHWEGPKPPTVWDERRERWIASTVAFAKHLESRGEHIQVSLVKHDDPRAAAHYLIDHLDDQTVQLYLSLLSAMEAESVLATRPSVRPTLDGSSEPPRPVS
ncbi:MAG TPA: hypothetical protein ENO24_08165 [Chloroflexi bacterium]|nr:hypothetical protein [Chloroflexota bacterium]